MTAAAIMARISKPPVEKDYVGLSKMQLALVEQSVLDAAKQSGVWRHVDAHLKAIRGLKAKAA